MMATVNLRAPLRDLAGGAARVDLIGATVAEVLKGLERDHPATTK